MDELFGVSLNLIMWVLVALLVIPLLSVALVALFNQVMFKIGLRNIPRRRSQTILIIVGLMLSTIIISAAFTTGDTVDRSITSEVYSVLGSLDETVQRNVIDDDSFEDPNLATQREASFPAETVQPLISALRSDPLVDFVIPTYSDIAVAVNLDRRLSSPLFNVLGLDPNASSGLPDIVEVGGSRVNVSDLGPGEIYVNKSAAEELDVKKGDTLGLITFGEMAQFRVKAVVEDRRLAGAGGISVRREGGLLPLDVAQSLFKAPGSLTMLAVSNKGDAREGYLYTDQVEQKIESLLLSSQGVVGGQTGLSVQTVKKTGVNIAELGANIFTTFFLVFGLFSIGAGILLIFMIFVMLAAERKSEMGMARAVGTKRADLVQMFLSEGMAYNLLSALVGTGLGVLVAFVISRVMASIFSQIDVSISPHVTARSLIISYSLGVVLTFLTVTFSSWRVSFLNIVRAIRDIPEPPAQKPQWRAQGIVSTLLRLVFKSGSLKAWGARVGLIILGFMFVSGAGTAGATGLQIGLSVIGSLLIALAVFLTFQFGFLFIIASIPLILFGMSSDSAFMLLFGLSLLPLGLALVARSFGANERIAFTATGLFLIYIWEIDFSVNLLEKIFGPANGDIEMFFLSGVMVTVAATFLVVYNADLILLPLTRFGRAFGALLPSIKMAIAYPLANRARTGMTMAMFCLVIFALTVMSSMNYNFERLFLSERALGGWQITVDENPTNPVGDLTGALRGAGSSSVNEITAVGTVATASMSRSHVCQLENKNCQPGPGSDFDQYSVRGVDESFLANSKLHLQMRGTGYASDEAVWQAVARDPSLAVVDSTAVVGDFGPALLTGVDPQDKTIDPIKLVLLDGSDGSTTTVTIIGVIEQGASATYNGLYVSQRSFEQNFGQPDSRRFFVQTKSGADNRKLAREIESTLLTTGAQAESLRYQVDKQNATFKGFFYLLQGFMGLGLVVGVAAVGVIAFRTVVERRQQIGMLRALGYTRSMIGLTFLFESAFIAFMGIVSGMIFAVILARQLITEEFANQGGAGFSVPWPQLLVIGALAFGFALLMTLVPSRQAASIPIAQALRYE